jgi:thioredoxin 1
MMTSSHDERHRDTDELSFEADLKSAPLVLLKFSGTWCPPCRALEPTIAGLVAGRQDLLVLSIDVDEQQALAQRFGVRSVPTMIAFRNGRPLGQLVGNASRSTIEKLLGG